MIVREIDCGTVKGIVISSDDKDRTASFYSRVFGRVLAEDAVADKKKVLKAGIEVDEENLKKLIEAGVTQVVVRSPLLCELDYVICSKCY